MQVHLSTDDKFIDYFIKRQRNYFPDIQCQYVVVSDAPQLKHVKSAGVERCSYNQEAIQQFLAKPGIDRVYVHFFIATFFKPILSLPPKIKVYWMFWGAEAFLQPNIYSQFLDAFSTRFYRQYVYNGKPNKILNRGIMLQSTWERYHEFKQQTVLATQAFRRVDFFCHYLPEDFYFLKKRFGLRATMLDFQYCGIDDISLLPGNAKANEQIAFVGNSGSEANNHISMLRMLKKKNVPLQKIYCPLSYSGHPEYIKMVIASGQNLFGETFVPLLSFMPRQEYEALQGTAGNFFHNHYRSQAYGNIAYQLYNNAKVYMNVKSDLYHYLSRHQLQIGQITKTGIGEPAAGNNNQQMIACLLSEEKTNEKFARILQ